MTSNIDFWNEGLCTFHPICVVLLLLNKTLRGTVCGGWGQHYQALNNISAL